MSDEKNSVASVTPETRRHRRTLADYRPQHALFDFIAKRVYCRQCEAMEKTND